MKLRTILLAAAFAVIPAMAMADPVTAFFVALGASASVAATLTTILINVALTAVTSLLAPKPKGPTITDAQINTRLDTAVRWQAAGTAAIGGASGCFAEFDDAGNLWYIVAHADAELTGTPSYILDGVPVTVDAGGGSFTAGDVTTDAFCLDDTGAAFGSSGTKVPVFRIYTVTPSASAVYGALPADFAAAFPLLPTDFHLAGVVFSIIRCAAVPAQNYRNAMKWRGPLGLGEPSVVMVGNFNRMYDPRNPAHDINTPATWTASNSNPAIVWAWWRTTRYGRNRPMSEINWPAVAAAANICDQTVLDRSSTVTPLYRCGVAFADSVPRQECERQILATMDGFVAYDAAGLAYPVPGYYTAPTLQFTSARDIISAQTQITDDGETAVDGVIVYYTEPSLGYTRQPCAPWQNPDWYDGVSAPNYQSIDVLGCQNHNQAVRLAKAMGKRIAPVQRAALGTTIKGILAKGQRSIDLQYDATFAGPYEIISPVEENESGMACGFSVVPIAPDRWTLNAGEEGIPPAATPAVTTSTTLPDPTGVALTSDGAQIRATFTAPTRTDLAYEFRYRLTGSIFLDYQFFFVNMTGLTAWSAVVTNGYSYSVSWRTKTTAGKVSAWTTPVAIIAKTNPTAPAALLSASATGGAGQITTNYHTANDANQFAVAIYRGATSTFGSATLTTTVYVLANVTSSSVETGVSAGTWYVWAVPQNNSGVSGTASGPFTVTVT